MQVTLLLPWFPIVLSVAVAGRLLGRERGLGVGFVCALFWIALVQASAGVGVWRDGWTVVGLIAGSLVIVFMGGWSGQGGQPIGHRTHHGESQAAGSSDTPRDHDSLVQISEAIRRFDEWRGDHQDQADPWPAFGEFVRGVLYRAMGASHVQLYHLRDDAEELVALHAGEVTTDEDRRSARRGVVGHVVTTGRTFVAGDPTQGALVERLAVQAEERIAWCFPISAGARRLGVVVVGRMETAPEGNRALMRALELLVAEFWCSVSETLLGRASAQRDPVSGLLTRPSFLRVAETTLRESFRLGEPVALVVVAIEGLRDLSDNGRWDQADEIVAEAARSLKDKLRSDDCLGRFDGSRLSLLLRRVDSELASLIVGQLLARLAPMEERATNAGTSIRIRCGVAGSGTEHPELRSLVSRALLQARRARESGEAIATDLPRKEPRRGPARPVVAGQPALGSGKVEGVDPSVAAPPPVTVTASPGHQPSASSVRSSST